MILPIFHAHKLQQIGAHRGEAIAVLPESELAPKRIRDQTVIDPSG